MRYKQRQAHVPGDSLRIHNYVLYRQTIRTGPVQIHRANTSLTVGRAGKAAFTLDRHLHQRSQEGWFIPAVFAFFSQPNADKLSLTVLKL